MIIKNARFIIKENDYEIRDIKIKDGKIEKISENIEANGNEEILDLKGSKYVLPGVIDAHVHFRDPGMTHKEDMGSGSKAAAKGGVTTYIDMPNTKPTTTTMEALKDKKEIASKVSMVNYAFNFGGTRDDNSKIIPTEGVASTKIFMNESTGSMLVEDDEVLKNIFLASKMISVHAEGEMVGKAIELNEKYGSKIYLCHISSKEELDIIREAKKTTKKEIYAEVTPHHLFLNQSMRVGDNEMLLRMKPELKNEADNVALFKAIEDGTIDTIGTDHAPHLLEHKMAKVTFGVGGIETALPLMLNEVSKGTFTFEKLIKMMANRQSDIFKIKKRGYLKEGYFADITVVDMDRTQTFSNDDIVSRSGWTPFAGMSVKGVVDTTIVNGNIVYQDGEFRENIGMEVEYE